MKNAVDISFRRVQSNCRKGINAAFLMTLIAAFPLFAQTPTNAFNRGNELYREGQFREALNEYETIMKQGYVSSELYFNIGNAC
ncbi:MAG TPA: hypothetical protein VI704_05370, partial [Bacteroidota bacterium]|nr:hypothetical protein [Bacteroidota bacterium]